MRIGIVSSQYSIATPPADYGGAERVNWFLYRELVEKGYDVTLFAVPGSQQYKSGKLVITPGGGEITPAEGGEYPPFVSFMENYLDTCDIFHDSTHHHELSRTHPNIKGIATIHNPNLPESKNPVMISKAMQTALSRPNAPVVYNGIPPEDYPFYKDKEDYFLYIGYVAGHKAPEIAMEVATRLKKKLIIAGHVHADYLATVARYVEQGYVKHVGIVSGQYKLDLIGKAAAAFFPVRWPEPGNLACLECFMEGTPVIASNRGCFSEYIIEERNGFLADSVEQAIEKVKRLPELQPERIREDAVIRFNSTRMAEEYLALYDKALNGEIW